MFFPVSDIMLVFKISEDAQNLYFDIFLYNDPFKFWNILFDNPLQAPALSLLGNYKISLLSECQNMKTSMFIEI